MIRRKNNKSWWFLERGYLRHGGIYISFHLGKVVGSFTFMDRLGCGGKYGGMFNIYHGWFGWIVEGEKKWNSRLHAMNGWTDEQTESSSWDEEAEKSDSTEFRWLYNTTDVIMDNV